MNIKQLYRIHCTKDWPNTDWCTSFAWGQIKKNKKVISDKQYVLGCYHNTNVTLDINSLLIFIKPLYVYLEHIFPENEIQQWLDFDLIFLRFQIVTSILTLIKSRPCVEDDLKFSIQNSIPTDYHLFLKGEIFIFRNEEIVPSKITIT